MNKKIHEQVEQEFIVFFRCLVEEKLNQKERTEVYDKFKELNSRTIELMEEEFELWKKQSRITWLEEGHEEQKADFRKMIEEVANTYVRTKVAEYSEGYSNGWECACNNILAKLGDDTSKGCGKNFGSIAYCGKNDWLCEECSKKTNTCICGHDKGKHDWRYGCFGDDNKKRTCKCKKFQGVGK